MVEIMNDVSYSNVREMVKHCLCEVQSKTANIGVSGIPSGFESLDELTDGFKKGKVYIVGGRPCMGKEEFVLSMIRNIVVESKVPALLFSTNNMGQDYMQRLLSIHCDISTSLLQQGTLKYNEWEIIDKGIGTLVDAPLFIHNCLDLPLNELIETVRNCIKEKATKIIFIDCLQMIDFAKGENSISERIAVVIHSLKKLACLFEIPIVVGSMLSRGVEYRDGIEGKLPQFMDLANSSYIEELADVVMMVHRPEYYRMYEDERGRNLHGVMEIYVKKNNLNPLGSILLDYHEDTGIVTSRKSANASASKPVRLKDFNTDNNAVKNLIQTFELEEELPF